MNTGDKSYFALFRELWGYLSRRRRYQYFALILLVILGSVFEVVSIGAVIPFITALTKPGQVLAWQPAAPLFELLSISRPEELILPITIIFVVAAILAASVRALLLWVMARVSFSTGAELSGKIYTNVLYQPYEFHLLRNSSEVMSAIIGKSNGLASGVINPSITILNALLMSASIILALFAIEPVVLTFSFLVLGTIYLVTISIVRKRIGEDSRVVSWEYGRLFKTLQEGLGGIRDIIIDGTQQLFLRNFRETDGQIRRASARRQFIGGSPRIVVETIGIVALAFVAFYISGDGGLVEALPLFGSIVLGANRLIPVVQSGYHSYITIRSTKEQLKDVMEFIRLKPAPGWSTAGVEPLAFTEKLEFKNVYFRYSGTNRYVLEDISFEILPGSRIGIVGPTGSGKSTLVDLMMGLIEPARGNILVDGISLNSASIRPWQMNIAHVPQSIYLADSTVLENIAFGVPRDKIDIERAKIAAERAHLRAFIETLPDGFQASIGERGARFSGGQRQRLGLARAFYKEANFLILDEATSALDNETERQIMKEVSDLGRDLTIVMIAHRLTTIQDCDLILQINRGRIESRGNYDEIFETKGN